VWAQDDGRSKEITKIYSAHPGIYEENNRHVIHSYFTYKWHCAEQQFFINSRLQWHKDGNY